MFDVCLNHFINTLKAECRIVLLLLNKFYLFLIKVDVIIIFEKIYLVKWKVIKTGVTKTVDSA